MKKLFIILTSMLLAACGVDRPSEVTVTGKVALIYTNGDKDTITVNETLPLRGDTSEVSIQMASLDGGICAIVQSRGNYSILASGVRKMEVININKTVK